MNRLYGELAWLWPILSPPEDYAHAACFWRAALRERLGPGRQRILELGAGGGHDLSHLAPEFEATAVDLSPRMLEHSRRLNPGVEHHVGDMRSVRLGRVFHAVLIHDAVDYLATEDDLDATFETARVHLEPGGVLVVAPDWYRETFRESARFSPTRSDGRVTLTHLEYEFDPDPADTTIESVQVFVIRQGPAVHVEVDRHVLGLFPLATWLARLEAAGFAVEKRPYPAHDDGREAWLLVGVVA